MWEVKSFNVCGLLACWFSPLFPHHGCHSQRRVIFEKNFKTRKAPHCDPALCRVGRSPPPSGVGGLAATVAVPFCQHTS